MAGNFISPDGDLTRVFITDKQTLDDLVYTNIYGWGLNGSGELGVNTNQSVSVPTLTIVAGRNWSAVNMGYKSSAMTKIDGTVWVCGDNSNGQLCQGNITTRSSPVVIVNAGPSWKKVVISQYFAGIKTDGTLWMAGNNGNGQLGDNTVVKKSSPVQTIAGGNNWKDVNVAGGRAVAAIKTDGTLWMWGSNNYGQLGNNSSSDKSSPVQTIAGGNNWSQVTTGDHTAAIKTDGTLWLWGWNSQGQLGDGTTVNKSSPVQTISGGTNWKQVSGIDYFTAAIKTDGTLWTWGYGAQGSLGNNSTANQSSPVQTIAGGTNWKIVRTGVAMNCAGIKTDGTLWLWGGVGTQYTMGDGSSVAKSSPVQTSAAGTNWKDVSIGDSSIFAMTFRDTNNPSTTKA